MGWLSWLFGASSQKKGFYVRPWAENRYRRIGNPNNLSLDDLFGAMMFGLSVFGKNDPRRNTSSELRGLGLDVCKHYSGDSTLFELGCYMYFQINLWLCKNEPKRREEICSAFAQKFIRLFTEALRSTNLSAIVKQRILGYQELAKSRSNDEGCRYHLSQLILRTKDNNPPTLYDFATAPVLITDAFERTAVEIELASWEQSMVSPIKHPINF